MSISNKFRSSFVGHSFAIVIYFSITYDPKKGHIKFACKLSLCLNFVFIFKLYCQTSLQSAETPSSGSTYSFIHSMFKCDIDSLLGIYFIYAACEILIKLLNKAQTVRHIVTGMSMH